MAEVDSALPPRASWRAHALAALVLVLGVLAIYAPVRAHGFVSYDDEVYLTANPHVAKGLDPAEIAWVFTHDHAANYHPLTWLSHMLDVELFALEPGPHHLVNVGLHALNALLVLALLARLTRSSAAAFLGAALFAWHPLRVESVAWASERKDVLCALFFLAAVHAHLAHARAPSAARLALVSLCSALALLAKPMAVTLPALLLVLDLTVLGRRGMGPWLEKLPLVLLAAAGALSTWLAQEVGGATTNITALPLDLRLLNALRSVAVYVGQTVWPFDLAGFYPLAALVADEPRRELLPLALVGLALVVLGLVVGLRARTRRPWLLASVLWTLGMLVPVIGLKQVGSQAHADRYTYLPLIGLAWLVAAGALELARERRALQAALLVLPAALVPLARRQVHVWRDTESLFTHALAVTERNYIAHTGLGSWLLEQGRGDEAAGHFRAALEHNALDANALTGLGRLELDRGELEAAEQHLLAARAIVDSKWVRYHLGRLRLLQRRPEPALAEYRAALELDPSLVDAHFNAGQLLYNLARPDEARAAFEQALALDPEHAGAWNGLGALALAQDDAARAAEAFARAVAADAEYADAHHNLAVALERLGRSEEARAARAEAQRLNRLRAAPR